MTSKRKKAWIGAAIGAAVSIGSSIFSSSQQNKAAKRQEREQRLTDVIHSGQENAAALSASLADQSYVNDYKQRMTLKTGGKMKNDRVKVAKQFKCGGRKKAEVGTDVKTNNIGNIVSQILPSIGNGVSSAISASTLPNGTIVKEAIKPNYGNGKTLIVPNYGLSSVSQLNTNKILRCGGKKRK